MDFDFGIKKTATGSDPVVKTGLAKITDEIKKEAQALAGSKKGLDIAAFQREHNIQVLNVDELLC